MSLENHGDKPNCHGDQVNSSFARYSADSKVAAVRYDNGKQKKALRLNDRTRPCRCASLDNVIHYIHAKGVFTLSEIQTVIGDSVKQLGLFIGPNGDGHICTKILFSSTE